jgi:hypothetical protein
MDIPLPGRAAFRLVTHKNVGFGIGHAGFRKP